MEGRSTLTDNGQFPEAMNDVVDIDSIFQALKEQLQRRLDYAAYCYNELTEYRKDSKRSIEKVLSWRELEQANSERIKSAKQAYTTR